MSVLGRETWILVAAGVISAGLAGVISWTGLGPLASVAAGIGVR